MQSYQYFYIDIRQNRNIYTQVLDLRYNVFFKDLEQEREIVIDEYEKDGIHLVCQKDEKIIGYCRLFANGLLGNVSQMVVNQEYRSLGIGSELMKRIEAKAGEIGINKLELNAKKEAIPFYIQLGYGLEGKEFASKKTGILHQCMTKNL